MLIFNLSVQLKKDFRGYTCTTVWHVYIDTDIYICVLTCLISKAEAYHSLISPQQQLSDSLQ